MTTSPTSPSGGEIVRQETSFAGPIPPPEVMQQYHAIDSNLPDRIVTMAEKDRTAIELLQRTIVESETRDKQSERRETQLGQWLGSAVALTAVCGGVVIAVSAEHWAGEVGGTVLSGGTIVAIVRALVMGRQSEAESKKAVKKEK